MSRLGISGIALPAMSCRSPTIPSVSRQTSLRPRFNQPGVLTVGVKQTALG